MSITWERCAELPAATAAGQCTVIDGKVYFGGGITDEDSKRYLVYRYMPTENQWRVLPQLPVKWFGLGQLNSKLVAVGGMKKDGKRQRDVYVFDIKKWKSTIPSMELARTFPAVANHGQELIVAGGNTDREESTNVVEIYSHVTSQWQKVAPLPSPCCNTSLIVSTDGNTLYAVGGYNQPLKSNQLLETSLSNLLSQRDPKKLIWTTLQPSPNYQPTTAVLYGNLLSVGGWAAQEGGVVLSSIHMYSPTAELWTYFSDLPEPCAWSACAVLSLTEILVIGGKNEAKVGTVWRGTLKVGA